MLTHVTQRTSWPAFFMIVSLIAVLVYVSFLSNQRKLDANQYTEIVYKDFNTIQAALKAYRNDNGRYPTTYQGLAALFIKPEREPIPAHWVKYLNIAPIDPWGKIYQYHLNNNQKSYQIYSLGPDGVYQHRIKLKRKTRSS